MTPDRLRALASVALAFGVVSAVVACSSETPTGPTTQPSPTAPILHLEPAVLARVLGKWSPEPVQLPADAIAAIDAMCRSGYDFPAGYDLQVVDARGEGLAMAFYTGPNGGTTDCLGMEITPAGELVPKGMRTDSPRAEPRPSVGPNDVASWDISREEAPRKIVWVAGVVGANVASVRWVSAGRPSVFASLQEGAFAVWFPDPLGWPVTVNGFDADGRVVWSNEAQ